MSYHWNPIRSAFILPNPPLKYVDVDGKKVIEFEDILAVWNEIDELYNNYEISFFEKMYKKMKKEESGVLKPTLEMLYAERKCLKFRKNTIGSKTSKSVLRWS